MRFLSLLQRARHLVSCQLIAAFSWFAADAPTHLHASVQRVSPNMMAHGGGTSVFVQQPRAESSAASIDFDWDRAQQEIRPAAFFRSVGTIEGGAAPVTLREGGAVAAVLSQPSGGVQMVVSQAAQLDDAELNHGDGGINRQKGRRITVRNGVVYRAEEPIEAATLAVAGSGAGVEAGEQDWLPFISQEQEPILAQFTPVSSGQQAEPTTISINFNNISIAEYVRFVSRVAKKNFTFDENELLFNVTIVSEEPMTVDDIMTALVQVLRVHDLMLIEDGDSYIIHKNPSVRSLSEVVIENWGDTGQVAGTPELVTQVLALNTLRVSEAESVVTGLISAQGLVESFQETNHIVITDLRQNVEKVIRILKAVDAPANGITVGQYVVRNNAVDVLVGLAQSIMAPLINDQPFSLVPHERSNSIFIVTTPFLMERIIPILTRIDQTVGTTGIFDLNDVRFLDYGQWRSSLGGGQESSGGAAGRGGASGRGGYGGSTTESIDSLRGKWELDNRGRWFFRPGFAGQQMAGSTENPFIPGLYGRAATPGATGAIPSYYTKLGYEALQNQGILPGPTAIPGRGFSVAGQPGAPAVPLGPDGLPLPGTGLPASFPGAPALPGTPAFPGASGLAPAGGVPGAPASPAVPPRGAASTPPGFPVAPGVPTLPGQSVAVPGQQPTPALPLAPGALPGSAGAPSLPGGAGAPSLPGGAGAPSLPGGAGAASLPGGAGAPSLPGGAGPTPLPGGAGAASLPGGAGAASLPGRAGAPSLPGGAGAPSLPGGAGPTPLPGGAGAGGVGTPSVPAIPGVRSSSGEAGEPGAPGVPGRAALPGPSGTGLLPGLIIPGTALPGAPGTGGEAGAPGTSGGAGLPGGPGGTGLPGTPGAAVLLPSVGIPGIPGVPGTTGLPGTIGGAGAAGEAGVPGTAGFLGVGITSPPGTPAFSAASAIGSAAGLPEGTTVPAGIPVKMAGLPGAAGVPGISGVDGTRGTSLVPGAPGGAAVPGAVGPAGRPGLPGTGGVVPPSGRAGSGAGGSAFPGQPGRAPTPGGLPGAPVPGRLPPSSILPGQPLAPAIVPGGVQRGGAFVLPDGTVLPPGYPNDLRGVDVQLAPPAGRWQVDPQGNWFFEPIRPGEEAAKGLRRAGALPSGRPLPAGGAGGLPGQLPGEESLEGPGGRWVIDDQGLWIFELDGGETIYSGQRTRFGQLNPQLPVGHIERTKFYIHKLQFRKAGAVEEAIRKIGLSLVDTESVNASFLATINSVQSLEDTNMLVISGPPEEIAKVIELLQEIDQPLRQVFIEVLIIETSIVDSLNYGVNWASAFVGGKVSGSQSFLAGASTIPQAIGTVNAINGTTGTATVGGNSLVNVGAVGTGITNGVVPINEFGGSVALPTADGRILTGQTAGYTLGIVGQNIIHKCLGIEFSELASFAQALHERNLANVLLNPKILTEDGVPAEIFVGVNTPYRGQSVSNDEGSVITSNFEYRDVGTRLAVTPTLGPGNLITLEIDQEVSRVVSGGVSGAGSNSILSDQATGPTTSKSVTKTRVHVPDGFFLIIGGMIRDEENRYRNQVPCLGGAPLLGALFGFKRNQDLKQNVMVFIRPKLIDTDEEYRNVTRHQQDLWRLHCKSRANLCPGRESWKYEVEGALDMLNIQDYVECGAVEIFQSKEQIDHAGNRPGAPPPCGACPRNSKPLASPAPGASRGCKSPARRPRH